MPRERTTIVDVAARAGVSKGLVSLALNRRAGVADATRDRILAVADELGWTPSAPARSLATARSSTLGLVIARDPAVLAADPFFPAFLAGVERALSPIGWSLSLAMVPSDDREADEYARLARERRVDGVLITDLRSDDPRLRLVTRLGLPAVTLGVPDRETAVPAVPLDDGQGIRDAVDHLVALGHRRIAHLAGPQRMLHGSRRRADFEAAMTRAGLEPIVAVTDFSAADGARATFALLELAERPTAIVAANDPMAIAAVGVAHGRGMRVPHDVSVTGFDGSEIGEHLFPALTTVVTEIALWGETAASALVAVIEGEAVDVPELPPARLLVRDSTAAPPYPV